MTPMVFTALSLIVSGAATERTPIILDTDIGTDIDDAFALALAVASPEIELRGVTTVSDDAFGRARIACRFLEGAGRSDVPVAAGLPPRDPPKTDGQYQYGLRPTRKSPIAEDAVSFIARRLREAPGRLTLVAVADLTNIAALLARHPDCAPLIRRIVIMGGSVRIGYKGVPPPVPEWNIKSDIAAAKAVFASGVPLVVAPVDATTMLRLREDLRAEVFGAGTPLAGELRILHDLWGKPTPVLFDPLAVFLSFNESFVTLEDLRIEVDDRGQTIEAKGKPNARVATAIDAEKFLRWYVDRVKTFGSGSAPRGGLPPLVHVAEDYETDIEKRWWLAGRVETENVPPSRSPTVPNRRACRGTLTRDFDDEMGDRSGIYRAVIFNPVPGPPMRDNTRLAFRCFLRGTDRLRVQIYSLSNGYHRRLALAGLCEGEWMDLAADMTKARRPDGSGGPLSRGERIDDIQFYADPDAELIIDDIVLYEAAPEAETLPFPRRIIFTGWFDTGDQGKEWPGEFAIVPSEDPRGWKAASSLPGEGGRPEIRVQLRGERALSGRTRLRFLARPSRPGAIDVALAKRATGARLAAVARDLPAGAWTERSVEFAAPPGRDAGPATIDEIRFAADAGGEFLVDDLLLYVP